MIPSYLKLVTLLNKYKNYLEQKNVVDPYTDRVPSLDHFDAQKYKPSSKGFKNE